MMNARALALRLLDNGYSPVPVEARTKATYLPDWPKYADQMPTEAEIEAWFPVGVDASIGIVCGKIIALDIDEDDPAKSQLIAAIAAEILGPPLFVRIGRPPRRLLVYLALHPVASRK